jgi:periplasmic copper chaperone A
VSLRLPRTGSARRTAAVALALALPLGLAGCGANFEAQTYQQRSAGDGTNAAVGPIAIRNVTLLPPEQGETHEEGDDVEVELTLTNDGPEDDRLVGASSPAATSVELLEDGSEVDEVELPRLGTTGGRLTLRLSGLTEELRPGRFTEITLTFESSGEVDVPVPVATTGQWDDERERSENFHQIGEEH